MVKFLGKNLQCYCSLENRQDDWLRLLTGVIIREFYFHKNSVLRNKFKDLKIGMKVRFVEELGEKGPQASTVKVQ